MTEKDTIKTIFNFFVIDLIIFAVFSYIIVFIFRILINLLNINIVSEIRSIILLVVLLVLMYWNYKYRYEDKFQEEDAMEILKIKYVKGEINKEEFEQMKKEIA